MNASLEKSPFFDYAAQLEAAHFKEVINNQYWLKSCLIFNEARIERFKRHVHRYQSMYCLVTIVSVLCVKACTKKVLILKGASLLILFRCYERVMNNFNPKSIDLIY